MIQLNEIILCSECKQVRRLLIEPYKNGFVLYAELCKHLLERLRKIGS